MDSLINSNADIKSEKKPRRFVSNLPPGPGPGRPKGMQNKITGDFRAAVNHLLHNTQDQMTAWLIEVAKRDPGRALDLMAKLAEYAAPKLSRTEVTGPGGGAVQIERMSLRGLSDGELEQMAGLVSKAQAVEAAQADVVDVVPRPVSEPVKR